jgi:hypothetical protein
MGGAGAGGVGTGGGGTGGAGGGGVGAGGAGVGGGVGAGVGDGGVGPGAGPPARCMRATRCPATVTATGRSAPVFAVTATEIAASPEPLDGLTDTQLCSALAVHEQTGWVRRTIDVCPPLPSMAEAAGLTEY